MARYEIPVCATCGEQMGPTPPECRYECPNGHDGSPVNLAVAAEDFKTTILWIHERCERAQAWGGSEKDADILADVASATGAAIARNGWGSS